MKFANHHAWSEEQWHAEFIEATACWSFYDSYVVEDRTTELSPVLTDQLWLYVAQVST